MTPGTLEAGTVDGKLYGLLTSMNVKSLVMYPKKAWAKAGYEPPTTIDELNTLTEKIKSDGNTPWCMGIEDGTGTGWAATDWFEDLVMRYGGPEEYKKWVKNETKFDSDVVKRGSSRVREADVHRRQRARWSQGHRQHQLRYGGQPDVRRRARLLDVQAGHVHHRLLPEGRSSPTSTRRSACSASRRPRRAARTRSSAVVTSAMMLDDSKSTESVMKMLAETDIGNEAAQTSSFISPHKDFDVANYQDDVTREIARGGLQVDGVPLRRFGPDARRGRCRFVLEGDDRVDQRSAGPGRDAEEHRRQLAVQLRRDR